MLNAGLCQYENENENNTESSFNHIFSVVKCVESLAYFWGNFVHMIIYFITSCLYLKY